MLKGEEREYVGCTPYSVYALGSVDSRPSVEAKLVASILQTVAVIVDRKGMKRSDLNL